MTISKKILPLKDEREYKTENVHQVEIGIHLFLYNKKVTVKQVLGYLNKFYINDTVKRKVDLRKLNFKFLAHVVNEIKNYKTFKNDKNS